MDRQLTISLGLIEREGKFLITRRCDPKHPQWHHRWEFPGGKIHLNETPLEALHREILEETGLKVHSPELLGVHTHHWKTSSGIQQTFMLVYHCQAYPGEIVLAPEENDDYSWNTLEELRSFPNFLEGSVELLQAHSPKISLPPLVS